MLHIFKRVAGWNAKRYDRELSIDLTIDLCSEEIQEYFDATEQVDELDAICDLMYLAMGGLWKAGEDLDPAIAVSALRAIESVMDHNIIHHPMSLAIIVVTEMEVAPISAMYKVIGIAQLMMLHMGFNQSQCEAAMSIVCDANDTKPAKKTASDVKANIDKGSTFVAPEPRLQKLLDSIHPVEVTH